MIDGFVAYYLRFRKTKNLMRACLLQTKTKEEAFRMFNSVRNYNPIIKVKKFDLVEELREDDTYVTYAGGVSCKTSRF